MELNFDEIDNNINNQNPYENFDYNSYDNNSQKYWEKPKETQTQNEIKLKKKKVSFDDILSNMNLVVNNNGSLQFITPTQVTQVTQVTKEYIDPPQQQNYFQQQSQVEPAVKHSYIYNKYFKDYQDASPQIPEVRVPKTKEEYFQMLLEDRVKRIEERKRISQIKSTKMMYTSNIEYNNNNTNNTNNTIQASKNSLRMMSFR
jgi:hypothetical protein